MRPVLAEAVHVDAVWDRGWWHVMRLFPFKVPESSSTVLEAKWPLELSNSRANG